jgi:hypothetical protein
MLLRKRRNHGFKQVHQVSPSQNNGSDMVSFAMLRISIFVGVRAGAASRLRRHAAKAQVLRNGFGWSAR